MRNLLTVAATGLFMLASVTVAQACGHLGKTADISKPVTTAEVPTITPAPKTGG